MWKKKCICFGNLRVERPELSKTSIAICVPVSFCGSFFAVQTCPFQYRGKSTFSCKLGYMFDNLRFSDNAYYSPLSQSRQTSSLFVFCMRVSSWCATARALEIILLCAEGYWFQITRLFLCVIVTCISRCQRNRVITITGQVVLCRFVKVRVLFFYF